MYLWILSGSFPSGAINLDTTAMKSPKNILHIGIVFANGGTRIRITWWVDMVFPHKFIEFFLQRCLLDKSRHMVKVFWVIVLCEIHYLSFGVVYKNCIRIFYQIEKPRKSVFWLKWKWPSNNSSLSTLRHYFQSSKCQIVFMSRQKIK